MKKLAIELSEEVYEDIKYRFSKEKIDSPVGAYIVESAVNVGTDLDNYISKEDFKKYLTEISRRINDINDRICINDDKDEMGFRAYINNKDIRNIIDEYLNMG